MLASGVDIDYRVGPKYISLTWEGQIPSRYIQPNEYFSITWETPLWSPFHVSSKIVERALPKFWKHDLVLHHHCCKSLKAMAVDHTGRNENTWGKAYEVRRAEAEDPPRRHTIMEDKIPSEQRASRHGVAPSAEGSNGAKSSLFGTSIGQSFENISGATRSHRPNFCPPPWWTYVKGANGVGTPQAYCWCWQ
jgi:hypothetical protein